MQLSVFTDYSFRVLMFAAARTDQWVTTKEIGSAYNISYHHLVKVVHKLSLCGFIKIRKGKGGGLQLAKPANEISLGSVVRAMEPDFHLVACFGRQSFACTIESTCGLKSELHKALQAFLSSLDQKTLADTVPRRSPLWVPKAS